MLTVTVNQGVFHCFLLRTLCSPRDQSNLRAARVKKLRACEKNSSHGWRARVQSRNIMQLHVASLIHPYYSSDPLPRTPPATHCYWQIFTYHRVPHHQGCLWLQFAHPIPDTAWAGLPFLKRHTLGTQYDARRAGYYIFVPVRFHNFPRRAPIPTPGISS